MVAQAEENIRISGGWSLGFEPLESRLLLSIVPGDFNFDGKLTNSDLPAMLLALQNLNGFKANHGLSDGDLLALGDINKDSALTVGGLACLGQPTHGTCGCASNRQVGGL